jgi:hypothetical protein
VYAQVYSFSSGNILLSTILHHLILKITSTRLVLIHHATLTHRPLFYPTFILLLPTIARQLLLSTQNAFPHSKNQSWSHQDTALTYIHSKTALFTTLPSPLSRFTSTGSSILAIFIARFLHFPIRQQHLIVPYLSFQLWTNRDRLCQDYTTTHPLTFQAPTYIHPRVLFLYNRGATSLASSVSYM